MAVQILDIADARYPELLRHIKSPPKRLYCRGDISILKKRLVALVGARRCSEYGKWAALTLGRKLVAQGIPVVSGMANGIDTWAHTGALKGDGPTVAVLGCGIDICYPKSNRTLMEEIERRGLIISEYPPGTHPERFTFPARNRIISGISVATVIVEAGAASGSLITAGHAAEQGREIYAMPGNIDRPGSLGCNCLIRDGAIPLTTFDDILIDLGIAPDRGKARTGELSKTEAAVYQAVMSNGEMTIDDAIALCDLPASQLLAILTALELKGLLRCSSGKICLS
jgi:DNA processing protein